MVQIIRMIFGLVTIFGFIGCGVGDSSSNSSSPLSGGSSSTDNLKIIQSGNNFKIIWDKKYEGYSEVVYMYEVTNDKRGRSIMHDNFVGKHILNCTLFDNSDSSVSYSCTGSGPTLQILGGQTDLKNNLYFSKGVEYKILMNYNASDLQHGNVNSILEFNGDTLTIQ